MPSITSKRVVFIGALLALGCASAGGGTIIVCPNTQYPTIQSGIDAAVDNDEVVVCDGTYEEYDLDFAHNLPAGETRAITVRSLNGPAACIIQPGQNGRAFNFHTNETARSVVRGFTIQNASVGGNYGVYGGAVLCDGSSPKLVNCRFLNNSVWDHQAHGTAGGGAIACLNGSSPTILNCQFDGNLAEGPGEGGAIYSGGAWNTPLSNPHMVNCTFHQNKAVSGAAIWCAQGNPMILRCQFKANRTTSDLYAGHVIYCSGSSPTIVNCLVADNIDYTDPVYQTTTYGGGIACVGGASPILTNCTIANNTSALGFAGLYCEDPSSPVLTNCIVWGNTPDANGEQIVHGSYWPVVTFSDIQRPQGVWPGTQNINADPMWQVVPPPPNTPPPPWDESYYLQQPNISPCVDAGNGSAASMGLEKSSTRLDLQDDLGTVDIGYHFPRDCNGNLRPDPEEVADGTKPDCNYNGVPDDPVCDTTPDCGGRPIARTFTSCEDFADGLLINIECKANQSAQWLQRKALAQPLPYLWAAASGRGTVLRIYTGTDGQIGQPGDILGEYYSAPGNTGASPSRTAVDLDGNVWVANRYDNDLTLGLASGSVVKLGLIIGGTRCDGSGTPNPQGQYLKPPFTYNTCIDRDDDGLIRTSLGLGNYLAWPKPSFPGTLAGADDEAICRYVRVEPTGTRHVSVNRDNDLWVGGWEVPDNEHLFQLRDGETGQFKDGFITEPPAGGYGGVIDCHDVLWSARNDLLRYETATQPPVWGTGYCQYSYGVGMDGAGNIWSTAWNTGQVCKLHPDGTSYANFPKAAGPYPKGVAVRLEDNGAWVANNVQPGQVTRLDSNGELLGSIELGASGAGPTAVAVDQDGFVWVTCEGNADYPGTVKRIDPVSNAVDMTTFLGEAASPYNFGNMTGQVTLLATGIGTWNVVYDGQYFGARWHLALWNLPESGCENPDPDALTVAVRAADNQTALAGESYVTAHNGKRFPEGDPNGLRGRYIEVRVRFIGSCPDNQTFETPFLCNLRVLHGLGDMNCDGEVNFADIDPFVLALSSQSEYEAAYPNCDYLLADCNSDGQVNFADIDAFVELLSG